MACSLLDDDDEEEGRGGVLPAGAKRNEVQRETPFGNVERQAQNKKPKLQKAQSKQTSGEHVAEHIALMREQYGAAKADMPTKSKIPRSEEHKSEQWGYALARPSSYSGRTPACKACRKDITPRMFRVEVTYRLKKAAKFRWVPWGLEYVHCTTACLDKHKGQVATVHIKKADLDTLLETSANDNEVQSALHNWLAVARDPAYSAVVLNPKLKKRAHTANAEKLDEGNGGDLNAEKQDEGPTPPPLKQHRALQHGGRAQGKPYGHVRVHGWHRCGA